MQKAGSLVPRTLISLQDVHSAQEVLVFTRTMMIITVVIKV